MTNIIDATPTQPTAPYRTAATSKGTLLGVLSSQWFSRPDDQRFLSLNDLYDATNGRRTSMHDVTLPSDRLTVDVDSDQRDVIIGVEGNGHAMRPTHWSFGQLCQLGAAPSGYLRSLPAPLAAANLGYGVRYQRSQETKLYHNPDTGELRAATGPQYGRIYDADVVEAVRNVAGNGTGDTRWKIPGMLEWSSRDGGTYLYNPNVDIDKATTTLFASDRDVFLFLCDDRNPIEIGRLENGEPDLVFRGFYTWNSEVGSKTFGFAAFYLRGVCQNRCLWGVEGFEEFKTRHTRYAPSRMVEVFEPSLQAFADGSPGKLIEGVRAAKSAIVAHDDDSRLEFCTAKLGLTRSTAAKVVGAVEREEGHKANSVWDFVQGLTAVARDCPHQDARLAMERQAGKALDKVA